MPLPSPLNNCHYTCNDLHCHIVMIPTAHVMIGIAYEMIAIK